MMGDMREVFDGMGYEHVKEINYRYKPEDK